MAVRAGESKTSFYRTFEHFGTFLYINMVVYHTFYEYYKCESWLVCMFGCLSVNHTEITERILMKFGMLYS